MKPDMAAPQPSDHSSPTSTKPPQKSAYGLDHRRIYPALVFIPLFYLLTRHGQSILFFSFVSLVTIFALWEFYSLQFKPAQNKSGFIVGIGGAMILLISMQWPNLLRFETALAITLFSMLMYQVMLAPQPLQRNYELPVLFFGLLYVAFPLGHLLLLRQLPFGAFLIFFVLLVSWAGDAAAYYAGKCLGSHPIAPVLSPQKTVEGFVGGLLVAPLVAWLSQMWFLPILSLLDCVVLGLLLTGIGLVGDLAESAFKRQAGVKDSGGLIPGHGGMLDRVDSLLLTIPTFYYYILLVKDHQTLYS